MSCVIEERSLSEIRETYAAFRIVSPKAESAMERSLRIYGQMSPVVCVSSTDGIELLDGFKRLRASRRLERQTVNAVFLDTSVRACKAGIIQLNRVARSISDLEEAMILQSLHRADGLSQVEIATLLGRDKSWVSRRISLIERLSDEVQEHLKLGLISVSVGRELARLPRGNQAEVLSVVLKQCMGKREVEKLVRALLPRQAREYPLLLDNVHEILVPDRPTPAATLAGFSKQLTALGHLQQAVSEGVNVIFSANARPRASLLTTTIISGRRVVECLEHLLAQTPLEDKPCR
jgi:ParB/RepB/Spo0J family partition protein